jgi:hypothetical protein
MRRSREMGCEEILMTEMVPPNLIWINTLTHLKKFISLVNTLQRRFALIAITGANYNLRPRSVAAMDASDERVVLYLKDNASVMTFISTLRGADLLAKRAKASAGHLHLPEMSSWCARAWCPVSERVPWWRHAWWRAPRMVPPWCARA